MADQTNINPCPPKLPRLRKTKYSVAEENLIQEGARKHNTSHSDDDLFTTPLASPATDTTDTVAETSSPQPSTSPGFVPNTLPSKPVSTKTVVGRKHNTSHSDDDLFTTPLASPATDTTDTVAETSSPQPSTSPGFVPNTLPSKPVSTKTVVGRKHNTSHSDDDLFTTPLASPATDTTDTVAETSSPQPSTSPGFVPNTLPSKPVSTKTVVGSNHHPENAKQQRTHPGIASSSVERTIGSAKAQQTEVTVKN
ncbi:uncharacterized protein [Mytilus edulis]|uniref:uncharacterized protein n=1 Tax=Mytilus edulis TaxID=6550 RepID=UPI0039F08B52